MRNLFYTIFVFSILSSCNTSRERSNIIGTSTSILRVPSYFPELVFDSTNAFTQERWALGKRLFFEKRFSIDRSISCASCHRPALAFSDSKALSIGAKGKEGVRNAPSLANIGYHPYFMREGGVPTLEMQVLVPIQEEDEFNHNMVNLVDSLKEDTIYRSMSLKAYGRELDPFVITRALGVFERSLVSGGSPYDKFQFQNDSTALSEIEIKGMDLFMSSKTNCNSCHSGFNFTNYAFKNTGLDTTYEDIGRMRLSGKEEDKAKFKVPSLRNVSLTAPYMHNGSIETLDEVIEHYNRGGKPHPNKDPLIRPLGLSEIEKKQLVAFLESLTDIDFANDPRWVE